MTHFLKNHETPTAKASQLSPAEVKQEILDDDSLSEEEKKVKIDALYAKPRTQKEMPMSRRVRDRAHSDYSIFSDVHPFFKVF